MNHRRTGKEEEEEEDESSAMIHETGKRRRVAVSEEKQAFDNFLTKVHAAELQHCRILQEQRQAVYARLRGGRQEGEGEGGGGGSNGAENAYGLPVETWIPDDSTRMHMAYLLSQPLASMSSVQCVLEFLRAIDMERDHDTTAADGKFAWIDPPLDPADDRATCILMEFDPVTYVPSNAYRGTRPADAQIIVLTSCPRVKHRAQTILRPACVRAVTLSAAASAFFFFKPVQPPLRTR
jgi:hypothetical protein